MGDFGAKRLRLRLGPMLWRPSSKKFGWLTGLNQEWTRAGWHQPRFTLSKRLSRDFAGAAKKNQKMKTAGLGRVPQGRTGLGHLSVKILAIDRQRNRPSAAGFGGSNLDGFFQMQLAPAVIV